MSATHDAPRAGAPVSAGLAGGRWFRVLEPRPRARRRLVCFPHAGGGATYFRRWAERLPPTVEVVAAQYPGREDRLREPVIDVMEQLSAPLARALGELSSQRPVPFVLFGHSMGGAVAYAVCRELERRGERLPEQLLVSACEAPARLRPGELHRASDERLRREIARLDGTRDGLAAHPELVELVLPALRGDYKLIETWRPPSSLAPLPVPISAWLGAADTELREDDAEAWRAMTSEGFTLRRFEGGHFYLMAELERVLLALLQALGHWESDWPSTP